MRGRFTFAILLAFTLLVAAAQCVAACTADECDSSTPPCHQHHHRSSNACHQDVQLAVAHAAPAAPAWAICGAALRASPRIASMELRIVPAFSPPERSPISSSILRI